MPENFTVPMPGKDAHDEHPAPSAGGAHAARDASVESARQKARELLQSLPNDPAHWPAAARVQLGSQLSDLAGELRLLGAGQLLWKPVLEFATALGRLAPNGAFPPLPRGPMLERIRALLEGLAAPEGPLKGLKVISGAMAAQASEASEKPDTPYLRMLLKKLGSD